MARDFLYTHAVRPLLFRMDAEEAHGFAHLVARRCKALWSFLSPFYRYNGNDLGCQFIGTNLANPVGLAAGFDKNGELVDVLGHLGFGYAEIGSVTAQARSGNPKPRLFRLPEDLALINRLGLNGEGADRVAEKLRNDIFSLPIGLNIAKTNDAKIEGEAALEDMLYTFSKIKDLPLAYVTVNASCPNTQEGIVTETTLLANLFARMQEVNDRKLPILVKLSPDASRKLTEDIVAAAIGNGLAGFVCGNTSNSRQNLRTDSIAVGKIGNGGLSGPPLRNLSLELCRLVFQLKSASQIIIGCGGINSGEEAYEFIKSGASVVQLYTALVYEGPTLPKRINEELAMLLQKDKLTLAQAIGVSTKEHSTKAAAIN